MIVPENSYEEDKISATRPEDTDCDQGSSDEETDDITSLQKDVSSDTTADVYKEQVRKRLSTVSEESNSQLTVSEEKGSLV